MRKVSALALVLLACWTADARAVELKNVRATFGPFGAPRPDNKMLAGDVYMLNFDVAGLTVDPKTGGAKYKITLEVFDPKGKQTVDEKDRTAEKGVIIGLGGNSAPEVIRVVLGVDKPAGKYKIVVTVEELGTKMPKQLVHEVELQGSGFGFIHVGALSLGLVGQGFASEPYQLNFSLVGMGRDAKKMPKVTVVGRMLDESGKPTTTDPMLSYKIPEDLPPGVAADFAKRELVPLVAPMFLNRPGRFTVEIEARDELTKKTVKFSYTLTVVDATGK